MTSEREHASHTGFTHRNDLLGRFAQHKVAANLLMLMMLLSGVWALSKLNTQFFPNFALDLVSVRVDWTGASAEDVETAITIPIERELRTLDGLRKMTSTSAEGSASITLEYEEDTDMGVALDQVKERVSLIRNLPSTSEEPAISKIIRYEPVARVLLYGAEDLDDLRPLAQRMERELLERGIAKIIVTGLPEEEIAIQVPTAALRELDMSLDDIAARVAALSQDIPAGTIGRDDVSRQLRALQQQRREIGFERLPLLAAETGRLLTLGDVAIVERRARARQTRLIYRGGPAVELQLRRSENADSLEAARILNAWLEEVRGTLPPGIEIHVYDQAWRFIKQRIDLLLKNGASGLVLVVAILFLFMNARVAGWVALGIPVSFMAALGALYAFGGSINMISLFALIMTLGIIVDDAIVVGEDAMAHHESGEGPLQAAEGGARRMFAPVMSSSLTTIAAFIPLMLVSGIIGNILLAIPMVVICVIIASLVESFLVLPGHLRQSLRGVQGHPKKRLRQALDAGFESFRDRWFRPLVTAAVRNPAVTLSVAVALLVLAVGLFVGGRVSFHFFPSPEGTILHANVGFVAGTPPRRVEAFVSHLDRSLREVERELGASLVDTALTRLGSNIAIDGRATRRGDQFGGLMVELTEPDSRQVRNAAFIEAWQERISLPPGIESFSIVEMRPGPPGRDVDVRLSGADAEGLKAAALSLGETLGSVTGMTSVEDDLPFGQQQLIYSLTPVGKSLGLTVESVGRQLRAAYDGRIAQIFQRGDDEVEVRVLLPDRERYRLHSLDTLGIVLPSGGSVPLPSVVEISSRRGFEVLRRADGVLSVRVSGDVDPAVANSNEIIAALKATALPSLRERFGVDSVFEGRNADQEETLGDMGRGGLLALALIYLVLAWVFASYGWPLLVMAAIPFGLVGAITGHWLLGIDLTVLSMFGLFGLSGIVVNDSIILVTFYKRLREQGMAARGAIIEAACQRLRAVLLTSLTTIAGLTPLMFETSVQAQFLIPMAVSISFGLGFATLLVLVALPTLLGVYERAAERLGRPAELASGTP